MPKATSYQVLLPRTSSPAGVTLVRTRGSDQQSRATALPGLRPVLQTLSSNVLLCGRPGSQEEEGWRWGKNRAQQTESSWEVKEGRALQLRSQGPRPRAVGDTEGSACLGGVELTQERRLSGSKRAGRLKAMQARGLPIPRERPEPTASEEAKLEG